MRRSLLVVCVMLIIPLVSCTELRKDPSVSSLSASYPTAEIVSDSPHRVWHGLSVFHIPKQKKLSDLNISIQGYYNGSVKFDSNECNIDINMPYKNSERISIPFGDQVAKRDCLVTFTVAPEYPKKSSIPIYGFRGHAAVKVTDGEQWVGTTLKAIDGFEKYLTVFIGGQGSARVILDGCGKSYDEEHEIKNGDIEIALSKAVDSKNIKTCVLDGAIITDDYEDVLITVLVSIYDDKFSALSPPTIEHKDNKIKITSEKVVSIISLDKQYDIDRKTSFDFNPELDHILRTLTVKGRSSIQLWDKGNKKWTLVK